MHNASLDVVRNALAIRTFPSVLRRLIGRNLEMSSLFSFPGFVIGISFTLFHFSGKIPLLKHALYMAVV